MLREKKNLWEEKGKTGCAKSQKKERANKRDRGGQNGQLRHTDTV